MYIRMAGYNYEMKHLLANAHDPFAVSKIGYLPKEISSMFSLFLRHG